MHPRLIHLPHQNLKELMAVVYLRTAWSRGDLPTTYPHSPASYKLLPMQT